MTDQNLKHETIFGDRNKNKTNQAGRATSTIERAVLICGVKTSDISSKTLGGHHRVANFFRTCSIYILNRVFCIIS